MDEQVTNNKHTLSINRRQFLRTALLTGSVAMVAAAVPGVAMASPRQVAAGQAVGLASTVLFGGSAIGAVPLGILADSAGYRALWPAAAVLTALGTILARGLPRPAPQLP